MAIVISNIQRSHTINILVVIAILLNMENQDLNIPEYVQQTSLLLDLPINDEYKDRVISNFEKIQDIAKIVNNFPLPESIEIAPTFEP
jgi:hypothetical protein